MHLYMWMNIYLWKCQSLYFWQQGYLLALKLNFTWWEVVVLPWCWPRTSNLEERLLWYQGNTSYMPRETSLKPKEVTSLREMQSEIITQTDSRLNVIHLPKARVGWAQTIPLGWIWHILLQAAPLGSACTGAVTAANRQWGPRLPHASGFWHFKTKRDHEILHFSEF